MLAEPGNCYPMFLFHLPDYSSVIVEVDKDYIAIWSRNTLLDIQRSPDIIFQESAWKLYT